MSKLKFSKTTLNNMLEEIIDEFHSEDNQMGMWECINYVKEAYKEEINTLEDVPLWISGAIK